MINNQITCINQYKDEIIVVAQDSQDTNMMPFSIFYSSNNGQNFINLNVIVENNFQLSCPCAYVYNGVIYTCSFGIKEHTFDFLNDDTVFIYKFNVFV